MNIIFYLILFSLFTFGEKDQETPHILSFQKNEVKTLTQIKTETTDTKKEKLIQDSTPISTLTKTMNEKFNLNNETQTSVQNANSDNILVQDTKIKNSILDKAASKAAIEDKIKDSSITFKLNNEVRLSQNRVSKNQKKPYANVPYTEVSLNYSLLPVNFFMELEFSPQSRQIISMPEINLSYTFEKFPVTLKTGQMLLPLGYRIKNKNLFLKELSLHWSLEKNQEDVGLTLQMDVWKKYLQFQVSGFGGYVKRDEDGFYRAPDFPPLIVNLKTKTSFGDGFVTWFKKDLALFDSLQTIGGGLHLTHKLKNLKLSVQGELWGMDEKNQTTLSWYVFPKVELNKWKAGLILGDINRFHPYFKKSKARASLYERIFQISWNIHPYITLTAERFLTKQRKGPFLNDLWAMRVQTQFNF